MLIIVTITIIQFYMMHCKVRWIVISKVSIKRQLYSNTACLIWHWSSDIDQIVLNDFQQFVNKIWFFIKKKTSNTARKSINISGYTVKCIWLMFFFFKNFGLKKISSLVIGTGKRENFVKNSEGLADIWCPQKPITSTRPDLFVLPQLESYAFTLFAKG